MIEMAIFRSWPRASLGKLLGHENYGGHVNIATNYQWWADEMKHITLVFQEERLFSKLAVCLGKDKML